MSGQTLQTTAVDCPDSSSLYGDSPGGERQYSTVRARRKIEEDDEMTRTTPQDLSYFQYYMLVVASVAKRLLIMLGDEDTIKEEQERLKAVKED
eukprot:CAMPEP_0202465150 /NCGR_PEP_ID=MMETSP1360-20130828/64562_1 /ASSEMBLY_ACC=CAM_ASM_000848 /TAXON_ID=515479 /ORGANISM="Licmophora paradoxa, Strain CCMP2313" /LENGTH=93 /DNA_ID=CAMNT_0049088763 /DNA_START=20 /DNA_END=301 /DNA_ORIENTATION=-